MSVTAEEVRQFVRGLGLPADAESRLVALTPAGLRRAWPPSWCAIGHADVDSPDLGS